jgi:hypothetical protein
LITGQYVDRTANITASYVCPDSTISEFDVPRVKLDSTCSISQRRAAFTSRESYNALDERTSVGG